MTFQPPPETPAEREARLAWERGGSTLLPPVGRVADRVVTVMLLAFGALLTVVAAIAGVVAAISATSTGVGPVGAAWGSVALGAGGAFVIGVATVIVAVAAWIRRRSSWWIAAVGFVLATACVAVGGVLFVHAADGTPAYHDGSAELGPSTTS